MLWALRNLRKEMHDYFYYAFDTMNDEQRLKLTNIIEQLDFILKREDF